jgi:hypothetical protein
MHKEPRANEAGAGAREIHAMAQLDSRTLRMVTLKISLSHTSSEIRHSFGDDAFGFERYRTELWGTDAVRNVGARLIPLLATGDVFVQPAELDALELEAWSIQANAESIALEVFDESNPGRGAVIVKTDDGGVLLNAWGGRGPAGSIRRYTDNLLRAITAARAAGCGIIIW